MTHAQAIDNLWYEGIEGKMNPKIVKEYFGHSAVFKTYEEADAEAVKIEKDIGGWTEYGIELLNYSGVFPE